MISKGHHISSSCKITETGKRMFTLLGPDHVQANCKKNFELTWSKVGRVAPKVLLQQFTVNLYNSLAALIHL